MEPNSDKGKIAEDRKEQGRLCEPFCEAVFSATDAIRDAEARKFEVYKVVELFSRRRRERQGLRDAGRALVLTCSQRSQHRTFSAKKIDPWGRTLDHIRPASGTIH
jgi:hypothetical protein